MITTMERPPQLRIYYRTPAHFSSVTVTREVSSLYIGYVVNRFIVNLYVYYFPEIYTNICRNS